MNAVRFPGSTLEELRAGLLEKAPDEGAALLLAERVPVQHGLDFLVREQFHVPPEHASAAPLKIEISPEFIARILKRARSDDLALFFAHSHPASTRAHFSLIDDAGERRLLPTVFQRAPSGAHGAMVFTATDIIARIYTSAVSDPELARVIEVGANIREHSWREGAPLDETLDRNVRALGEAGQQALSALRIGIVGLGGLGSQIAQYLAHLGVRHFVLIDHDRLEATNLNRVVGGTRGAIGKTKVQIASSMIQAIQPHATIDAIAGDVRVERDAHRLVGLDVIFGCTDTHGSRAILNQLAHQYMVPVIDTGVRIDAPQGRISTVVGRVQLIAPGLPCLICDGLLDSEQVRRDLLSDEERRADPYIVGAHEPQPAVISINGTVASLATTMLLSAACGFPLSSRHQLYFADKGTVRNVAGTSNDRCFVCSASGAAGRGNRWSMPWRRG
jgi:molybdopterin-synthase adenylyltransferase